MSIDLKERVESFLAGRTDEEMAAATAREIPALAEIPHGCPIEQVAAYMRTTPDALFWINVVARLLSARARVKEAKRADIGILEARRAVDAALAAAEQQQGMIVRGITAPVSAVSMNWLDEEGEIIRLSSLADTENNARKSRVARRLTDDSTRPDLVQGLIIIVKDNRARVLRLSQKSRDEMYKFAMTTQDQKDRRRDLARLKDLLEAPVLTDLAKFKIVLGVESWGTDRALSMRDFQQHGIPPVDLQQGIKCVEQILVAIFGPTYCIGMFDILLAIGGDAIYIDGVSIDFVFYRIETQMRDFWELLRKEVLDNEGKPVSFKRGKWRDQWDDQCRQIEMSKQSDGYWQSDRVQLQVKSRLSGSKTSDSETSSDEDTSLGRKKRVKRSGSAGMPILKAIRGATPTRGAARSVVRTSSSQPAGANARPPVTGATATVTTALGGKGVCMQNLAQELGIPNGAGQPVTCRHGAGCKFIHDWKKGATRAELLAEVAGGHTVLLREPGFAASAANAIKRVPAGGAPGW